jgi:hypothetical protein
LTMAIRLYIAQKRHFFVTDSKLQSTSLSPSETYWSRKSMTRGPPINEMSNFIWQPTPIQHGFQNYFGIVGQETSAKPLPKKSSQAIPRNQQKSMVKALEEKEVLFTNFNNIHRPRWIEFAIAPKERSLQMKTTPPPTPPGPPPSPPKVLPVASDVRCNGCSLYGVKFACLFRPVFPCLFKNYCGDCSRMPFWYDDCWRNGQ